MWYKSALFDACAFKPADKNEEEATKELLKLYDYDEINIIIPDKVNQEELSKAPQSIKDRWRDKIYVINTTQNYDERREKEELRNILFGNKQTLNESDKRDIDNVCEANKYGNIFVTVDKKHILSKKGILKKRFNLFVFSPLEYLTLLEEKRTLP